ncbi:hypothetical protein B0T16DRAFT_491120 [Cercophora newfieldiana]|uniref:Rhodopsin domain-containing protein n=1 Tax=Cercophora newfieldiana TaxID=92897 RepID=A0AA39YAC6_9PEZI|nr:hypothetical protein B0T16DRAFT_491120 [Cercophora newfieldiana]
MPIMDPAWAAESNLVQILSIVTVIHLLALACVLLRLYTRLFVVKSPGVDDLCMALSLVCASGGWAGFLIQAHHGLGRHIETVSKEDFVVFMHVSFSQAIVSATCALAFLKLSIGFNLLRLSTCKWYIWSLRTTMVIVVCYSIMAAMTFFFHCKPLAGSWDISLKPKCYSIKLFMTFGLVNTFFNIATDVLFATFPVFIIWPLKMRRKLRIYLICILSLGYFAVALGAVKAVYQCGFIKRPDITFNFSVIFWGFLELNIGIIAACAVTLKPLLNRFIELGPSEHYHPYNGSAIPFLRRHQSLHINLQPHPGALWAGPKHSKSGYGNAIELGHIRNPSKKSIHRHHRSNSTMRTTKTHSPATSKSSESLSFYDLDKEWDVESTVLAPPPPQPAPTIPPRSPLRVPVAMMPSPLFAARSPARASPPRHDRSVSESGGAIGGRGRTHPSLSAMPRRELQHAHARIHSRDGKWI